MRHVKYQFPLFSLYDATGVARHLEQMAAKGWMLCRVGRTFWRYEAIEPKTLHFSATFLEKASSFDPEYSDEKETFHAFCQRTGWTFVAGWERMQIFCNEREDTVALDTDPETQLRVIHRAMRATLITYGIFALLSLFLAYGFVGQIITDPITILANSLGFFTGLCSLLLLIISLGELINYFVWRRKARQAAARGGFLPTKGINRLNLVCMVLLGGNVLFYLLSLRTGYMGIVMLVYPLTIFLGVQIGEVVKRHLKRHGATPGRNRGATAFSAGITAGILSAILIPVLLSSASSHPDPSLVLLNDPPVDLAVLTEQDISDVRNIDYNHSVLFTRYTMTLQSISVDDADFWLTYTATKPGIPFLNNWCKEQLLNRYAPWRLRDKQGEFRQIESGFGNDTEVWVFYDEGGAARNHYLLCYDDHIVELFPGWTLNQQQMQLLGAMLRAA